MNIGVDVTGALPRKFVIDVEETLSALLSSEGENPNLAKRLTGIYRHRRQQTNHY
jgi:hypothetical protein